MVRIERKDRKIVLVLDEKEAESLAGLEGELELFQPKKGLLVLTEKPVFSKEFSSIEPVVPTVVSTVSSQSIDEKLFHILSDRKQLSVRIEGKFEKTLNAEEKKRFDELLKDGWIEKFKLNEQYRNAVYRWNEKKGVPWKKAGAKISKGESGLSLPLEYSGALAQPSSFVVSNNPSSVSSTALLPSTQQLQKSGFAILKTDSEAREFSNRFFVEFKKGELRGIKSFDGTFLVMKTGLLNTLQPKLLGVLERDRKASLQALSEATQTVTDAVRIACEFLREDGHIFEKTKNQYCLV